MKKLSITILALLLSSVTIAFGQTAAPKPVGERESGITPNYALGDVMAIDAANNRLLIRTKVGDVSVLLDDKTRYLRVPPGATNTEKAEAIPLTSISIGDRAMAMGKVSDDRKSLPARRVIIMSKAAIAQKQQHDKEEWQRRGVVGTVAALNPAANEISLSVRSREGLKTLTVAGSDTTRYSRYTPDSVKFSDAKPSTYSEIKVGDQLRALGEKSADGTRFTPMEVVSGTFRTVAGTIAAVDPTSGEVRMSDLQKKQAFTVVVNKDSMLRRIPAEMAARFATGGQAGAPGRSGPRSEQDQTRRDEQRDGRADTAGRNGPRAGMGGGFDIEQFLERLPEVTVSDLKPGDLILVASTSGADPGRLTAIKLVAGIEPLLRMFQARQQLRGGANAGGPGFGTELSGGLPEFGIGLP